MSKENLAEQTAPEILERGREVVQRIETEVRKVIYGPELQSLIDILTMAVFTDGHVIVRASVGLAKTLTCDAFAHTIGGTFRKKQFLPDMLPTDLVGHPIYNQKTQEYEVQHGPLYGTTVFLADEVNRATPKAQAALLGAMQERRLTIRNNVYELEPVFLVLATRNPIEHEGTYELPEAQLDRFAAQATIERMSEETALQALSDPGFWRPSSQRLQRINQVTTPDEILAIRGTIFDQIHVETRLEKYILRLVEATWQHELVNYGSSFRGAENLKKAAMFSAFREGRQYATPEDVGRYAIPTLSHRIFLKREVRYDPQAKSPTAIIREVLDAVKPD